MVSTPKHGLVQHCPKGVDKGPERIFGTHPVGDFDSSYVAEWTQEVAMTETNKDVVPPPSEISVIAKLSVMGLIVGVLAGAGAAVFIAVQHAVSHWLWHTLPELMGLREAPMWLTILLPMVGAGLVAAALKLPGHGGHGPLDGLALNIGPREVASVLLASLAGLTFGAVLGPEAPLLALGTAVGAAVMRTANPGARQIMMTAGAMAAAGAIFGNPLVTAIMLLEFTIISGAHAAGLRLLVPSMAGLAGGYLLQVGVAGWTGLGQSELRVPGLASYPVIRLGDLVWALLVSAVVAAVTSSALRLAHSWARLAQGAPTLMLLASGAVIGLVAVFVMAVTGEPATMVVMSGQGAMGRYVVLASLGTALLVLVAKFVGYAVSLGGGFRGGLIFPSVAMGTIMATMVTIPMGTAASSGLIAAGIGAAVAAALRLPFTATLLAVLLTIGAGPAVTVLAIIGAVIGLLMRLIAEKVWPVLVVGAQGDKDPAGGAVPA